MQIIQYSPENLSPIGWKPSYYEHLCLDKIKYFQSTPSQMVEEMDYIITEVELSPAHLEEIN